MVSLSVVSVIHGQLAWLHDPESPKANDSPSDVLSKVNNHLTDVTLPTPFTSLHFIIVSSHSQHHKKDEEYSTIGLEERESTFT